MAALEAEQNYVPESYFFLLRVNENCTQFPYLFFKIISKISLPLNIVLDADIWLGSSYTKLHLLGSCVLFTTWLLKYPAIALSSPGYSLTHLLVSHIKRRRTKKSHILSTLQCNSVYPQPSPLCSGHAQVGQAVGRAPSGCCVTGHHLLQGRGTELTVIQGEQSG